MKNLSYLFLFIGVIVSFWSCKDSKDSEKVVDEFYGYLIDGKFEPTIDLCSDIVWENHEKDEWLNLMQGRNDNWGLPKTWESTYTGFKTSKIGKITELRFEVTNEGGKTYETFEFIEEDGKMKIVKYSFTGNSDYVTIDREAEVVKLPVFETEEKTVEKFFSAYNTKSFNEIFEFVSKKYVAQEDIENLVTQFEEKFNTYGKIISTEKWDAAEFGEDNNKSIGLMYKVKYENKAITIENFEFSTIEEIGQIKYYTWSEQVEK